MGRSAACVVDGHGSFCKGYVAYMRDNLIFQWHPTCLLTVARLYWAVLCVMDKRRVMDFCFSYIIYVNWDCYLNIVIITCNPFAWLVSSISRDNTRVTRQLHPLLPTVDQHFFCIISRRLDLTSEGEVSSWCSLSDLCNRTRLKKRLSVVL